MRQLFAQLIYNQKSIDPFIDFMSQINAPIFEKGGFKLLIHFMSPEGPHSGLNFHFLHEFSTSWS